METRREKMARIAEEIAADPSHGYSQKPPSGRWGPDWDCSSLIYEIASRAGYPVGTGPEKTRFTGTMLKDFKDAGFQILPFANVGLGELEIGDILLNLALHAEVYVGEGQVVGAQSSETGGYVGEAGDQTGEEIVKKPAYVLDKGWDYVLRPPEDEEADSDDDREEDQGGQEMAAYPYNGYGNYTWSPTMGTNWSPMNNQRTTLGNMGYPQGNLGQMNGYSQANGGGYQNPSQGQQGYYGNQQGYQQGMQQGKQLTRVNGIEGAKEFQMGPNSCEALFDANENYMYIKTTDQQGFPSLRVFWFEECSEEIPQHMPMMPQQNQQFVTRQEFDELKGMIEDAKQLVSSGGQYPAQQGNASSSAKSGNGSSSNRNARSN